MKKKIYLLLITMLLGLGCTGCEHRSDNVEIYNRSVTATDNISIKIKDGYFYNSHEKFTVDENKIGVTIYFTCEDTWE